MRSKWIDFESPLANGIRAFIAYKRSLGRKFYTEEKNLRLLDRYLVAQKITHTNNVTPDILDSFLASRPRKRPRSYNDLVVILKRFFNWLVVQEIIESSPLNARRKRETDKQIPYIFDTEQARRLLGIASCLADSSSAPMRGATYQMIFALLYGLGLRVGEVSRLRRKDIDFHRDLLIIRQTKFSKSRLVPFGSRMSARLHGYIRQRENRFGKLEPDDPVFSFRNNRAIRPATISQAFHYFILPLIDIHLPPGVSLLFALITSCFFTILSARIFNIPIFKLFLIFLFSILSHLALDYLMGAGLPVPLFAPFSYEGFLSPIKLVPCAFYSKSVKGLFQLLFYPPALVGLCLEVLIFLPIILLLKKNWSKLSSAVLFIIFIFAATSTYLIYNVMI